MIVEVSPEQTGWRADRALGILVPDLSRRDAKAFFHARLVRLNGKAASGSERVTAGDRFELPGPDAPAAAKVLAKVSPPRLTTAHGRHLPRLYEDEDILVIAKPAEVPVHRGDRGYSRRETVEDVLAKTYGPDRCHFVHRLDMETSGCLVIAKNEPARDALIRAFSAREVKKEYLALVAGTPVWERTIVRKPLVYARLGKEPPSSHAAQVAKLRHRERDQGEGRIPRRLGIGQKKGRALEEGSTEGKASETRFEVLRRYKGYALLRAVPRTGRTHQIRIHLQSIGYPLACDPLYGRATPLRLSEFDFRVTNTEKGEAVVMSRLPLHAWKLAFKHPRTGADVAVEAPLPGDLKELLRLLKHHRGRA
jgi:23S rRNA pseudouridine1911/1915/1917 synthase